MDAPQRPLYALTNEQMRRLVVQIVDSSYTFTGFIRGNLDNLPNWFTRCYDFLLLDPISYDVMRIVHLNSEADLWLLMNLPSEDS